jgi:hypothetical protein
MMTQSTRRQANVNRKQKGNARSTQKNARRVQAKRWPADETRRPAA